jgi:chemotaxis protein methyltransferase CheR
MNDGLTQDEATALLIWAAPRLGLRWTGFSHLRRQVCRRISKRAQVLGISSFDEYRTRLESDSNELAVLDSLCFVTISRFYRDAPTFDALRAYFDEIEGPIRVWSAGCASGEEPYSVAMLSPRVSVIATDRDDVVLARAATATYGESSLRELPFELRSNFDDGVVKSEIRAQVQFERADVRTFEPDAPLHAVLCRNCVFTYFDEPTQHAFAERVAKLLVPGGVLVVGKGERAPSPFEGDAMIYRLT